MSGLDALQKNMPLICSGHSRPVPDISFSRLLPDGGFFLISSCLDKNPMLRDGMTGDWLGTFEGHKGATWCARLNADASQAVTGSADFSAKLWDATTGDSLLDFPHKHIVKACGFNEAGTHILTAGNEKLLRIWDLAAPGEALMTIDGAEKAIKSALWINPDSIVTAGEDAVLRLYDARAGSVVKTFPVSNPVLSVELSLDGATLTVATGNEVKFLDTATLEFTKSFEVPFKVGSASLHGDRKKFIAGGHDFWVHVFDFETGEELEVQQGHHGPVHAVSYSPDGDLYASAGEDGTIRLWQTVIKPYGLWQYPLSAEEREKQAKAREAERQKKNAEEAEKKAAKKKAQEEKKQAREDREAREQGRRKNNKKAAEEGGANDVQTRADSPPVQAPSPAPASSDDSTSGKTGGKNGNAKARKEKSPSPSSFNPNAAHFMPSGFAPMQGQPVPQGQPVLQGQPGPMNDPQYMQYGYMRDPGGIHHHHAGVAAPAMFGGQPGAPMPGPDGQHHARPQ